MTDATAALKIPILPHTSPAAPQPPLKTPLYPHQLRALSRCLLIENDGSLSSDFGAQHDYHSRGGCLADAVGMGKTATMIGLIASEKRSGGDGDTLVVAPGHLINQWKSEIEKFSDDIEVLTGKAGYKSRGTLPPSRSHRVVLVDVDTVLQEARVWYDFKRIFSPRGGQLRVDKELMETYRKAALFCVKSPRGPCSYTGWVYTGCLHLPFRPWRRVIFDEIQDLVSEGTESQKNLLQLSRTAKNVWLLTATPFPHGNTSVYANHELLGFCRLRLNVEVNYTLPYHHPFEKIKRKLYIRSPKHVSDEAVSASKTVTKETIYVDATALERKFYQLEMNDVGHNQEVFSDNLFSLRQMMVHPEASKKLREQINGKDEDQRDGGKKAKKVMQKNKAVGRYATVDSFARSSLAQAKERYSEIEFTHFPGATRDLTLATSSLYLALKIRQVRASPVRNNPFANQNEKSPESLADMEAKAIREYYGRGTVAFETLGSSTRPKVTISGNGAVERIIEYFRTELKERKMISWDTSEREALEVYISTKEASKTRFTNLISSLSKEKFELKQRIIALEATVSVGKTKSMNEDDELASRHGSKSAKLIRFLQAVQEKKEQTIVFSYWHDTLSLVHRSLKRCGLSVSFCDGSSHSMAKALSDFTTGGSSVLLLSAKAKASGANLQCATNVVLLDPAGASAQHGAALENQAIGRAVRMGQANAVKVVRFCVKDSIEEDLFEQIDDAARKLDQRSNDKTYTCEDAHKSLTKGGDCDTAEDADDCCIGESITVQERVSRMFEAAKANNEVICLDDSDDEEVKEPAKTKVESTAVAAVAASTKRCNKDEEISAHLGKRTKTTPDELLTASSVQAQPRPPYQAPPQVSVAGLSMLQAFQQFQAGLSSHQQQQSTAASIAPRCTVPATSAPHNESLPWRFRERLEELKHHKEETGLAFVTGQATVLARWCQTQRASFNKGTLSAIRVKALNDIGFPWNHTKNALKQTTPGKMLERATQKNSLRVISPQHDELNKAAAAGASRLQASSLTNKIEAAATPLDKMGGTKGGGPVAAGDGEIHYI